MVASDKQVGCCPRYALSGSDLHARSAYEPCPTVKARQNGVSLVRVETDDAPAYAGLLITLQCSDLIGCERVKLFGVEADCDRTRGPITSGAGEHLLKLRDEREFVAILRTGESVPSVTILHCPACSVGISASDDDRRMRLLNRLRVGDHGAEIDKCAVIFSLILCPDGPHGFHPLLHELV